MAHSAVVSAVKTRLATWESIDECPLIDMNDATGGSPPAGTPFIYVQFPVSATQRMTVNESLNREEGGFRFVLHEERGAGTVRLQRWGNEIAALFRRQTFDGVETRDPTSPFFDDSNDQGSYFIATVVVPYVFNFRDEDDDPTLWTVGTDEVLTIENDDVDLVWSL
jgi:hypothetical protein